MKHGKKPTVKQSKIIAGYKYKSVKLNPVNWLVFKDLPNVLWVRHRSNNTEIPIPKGGQNETV